MGVPYMGVGWLVIFEVDREKTIETQFFGVEVKK